jgi:hypothetical protein
MLIFSLCLMYNYYMRLVKIDRDRILYSAFTTDQDLAHTAAYLQNHNIRL